MNFVRYRELLAVRPIRQLLLLGMVARIPHSAAGVLLTLHIVLNMGLGYAAAGTAAAATTIGIALGAPWRGRRVDTVGLRKALVPSVISETVIWAIVPHAPYQWVLPLVLIGGLFALPIFSVFRQSLGVLASGEQRRTAFALDAITSEMVFMIGPAAGAILATNGLSVVGLTVVGISTSLAGLFLIWFNPPTRSATPVDAAAGRTSSTHLSEAGIEHTPNLISSDRRAEHLLLASRGTRSFSWLTPEVAALFAVAGAVGLVLSGSDVGIVGALESKNRPSDIGIVILFWCAASVIGGLIHGAMHRPVSPTLLLLGMAALIIPMGFAQDTWTLALMAIPPGLLCAPVLSSASQNVADLVDERRRGEAMGWYGSALTAGLALGAPLAGLFIDGVGPSWGFISVGAAGVVLSLIVLALQHFNKRRSAA